MTDFEKIFNEKWDYIFRYLMKLSKDLSLAEELTQETFFRAYMNFSSLRNREKASVWLCQIAKNTYYAWYNDQRKTESIEYADNICDTESVEDTFIQKELAQKALSCLHELEEPYKEVFMLAVFGNF